ncbi:MAG TPA: adenosylcobinamide-GDP ribazoletransferase [Gammaproteobacteria bacterium]|nr:adenosylcobinamide-GDP ribazoletransferase [Gammaproteobacteria bacterium]
MRPFFIALQFLTRIPVRLKDNPNEKQIAASQLYYPLIGLLIGVLLILLVWVSQWVLPDVPTMLRAAIILTGWVLISGGLHLDGLADSADAWAGGLGDRDKTLAIMKDPACGPAGVVSIVLLLLLKFAALHALLEASASASMPNLPLLVIVIAPMLARTVPSLLFLTTPYVRQHGLGSALVTGLPRRGLVFVIAAVVVSVLLLAGSMGLWLVLAVLIVFVLARRLMIQRIGGVTGDVAGALIEITELSVLVCALLFYSQ